MNGYTRMALDIHEGDPAAYTLTVVVISYNQPFPMMVIATMESVAMITLP